ncbi:hypothetical protein B1H10_08530 [candidate division KSB1 bacterium 4484_188]|nr:MAG: hypothetical protein B1H10_08530 [candidate division KSB1 bacterium 4484_188]
MRILLFLLIFILSNNLLFAGTCNYVVILENGDSFVSSALLHRKENLLFLKVASGTRFVPIDSIYQIRKIKESHVGSGILVGLVVGAVIDGAFGRMSYHEPKQGLFTFDFGPGLPTAAGAVIGGLVGPDEIYIFYGLPAKTKLVMIDRLLSTESDVP